MKTKIIRNKNRERERKKKKRYVTTLEYANDYSKRWDERDTTARLREMFIENERVVRT